MTDLAGLDLRRLRTLDHVARHRSFSAAAAALHFTQPAVSQQIATLERDLGTRLVHRNPVSLTEAGAALCRRYEAAVAELAAARAELEAFSDGGAGRLRVASSTGTAAALLPRAVAAVCARHAGVDIWVTPLGHDESLAAVRRGEADIAVTHRFDAAPSPRRSLEERPLLRDRLTVAVPCRHRLASREAVSLGELATEKWVHVPDLGVPQDLLSEAMRGAAFRPVAVVGNGDVHSAQALVGAGVGITLVPELDHRHDVDIVHLAIDGARTGRSIFGASVTLTGAGSVALDMLDALAASARAVWPQLVASRSQAGGVPQLRAL